MIPLTTPFSRQRAVPHVVADSVEDNFSGLWVTDISFRGTPTGPTQAVIILKPFDTATGVLDEKSRRLLVVEDVMNLATRNPGVAAAMEQLTTAIGALVEEHQLNGPGGAVQVKIPAVPATPADPV